MKFNPFKRKPSPALDALKERFETAKNMADPAEKYMALGGVLSDAMEGYYNDSAGAYKSDNYYPTMGKSFVAAAAISGVVALCFTPALPAVIAIMAVGGGVGGMALGIGACEYKSRMGHGKEYLQIVEAVSEPMAAIEKATTNVAVTQLPSFAAFSKKYPDVAEHFRSEARKEKIDALTPEATAKLLADTAPAKPDKDKPGLSL